MIDKFIRSQLEMASSYTDGAPLESARALQARLGRLMHFTRRRDVVLVDEHIKEPKCSLMVPRDEIRGGVIIYLHGGGYVCGNMDAANGFAAVLSAECGMRVVAVEYRLAPENPYPAAIDDALAAYRAVMESGTPHDRIIIAGDSAGGGLSYALCLKLKELGEPQPAGIIAISPWCDLTLSGQTVSEKAEIDPILTKERLEFYADCYIGESYCSADLTTKKSVKLGAKKRTDSLRELLKNPLISPVFADVEGFPPSLIFVGEDEMLLSDSLTMKAKLEEAGCRVQLIKKSGMWHDYVLYGLKRNRDDFDKMNAFIRHVLPAGNERKLKWMQLDNAAKIYPASGTSRWSNIYRMSMTLTEEVDRDVLQSALDVTVRRFPSIAVRLRRGVFWYYLEEIPHAPRIMDEKCHPLVRMPFDDIRHCAFRVIAYKNRIACEFFHSLTDGSGALVFLKTLVAEYLTQKYKVAIPATDGILDRLEAPTEEERTDQFPRHKATVGKSRREANSYRIQGTPEEDGFCHVTTMIMDSDEPLALARRMGVTVTALFGAAVVMAAIRLQNQDVVNKRRQKEVKVLLPCDLRRLFGVNTLRNFALYITPGVDPRLGEYTLEEIAGIIHKRMALEITDKNMRAMVYTNVKDEENMLLKLTPLFIKNAVMKLVFNMIGERKSLMSVSNLGVVKLPSEMEAYVRDIDFTLGTQLTSPYNIGAITYGGSLRMNIIRNIKEPRLERELYRVLRDAGLRVRLESNER